MIVQIAVVYARVAFERSISHSTDTLLAILVYLLALSGTDCELHAMTADRMFQRAPSMELSAQTYWRLSVMLFRNVIFNAML